MIPSKFTSLMIGNLIAICLGYYFVMSGSTRTERTFAWGLVLMIVVIIGFGVTMMVRRKMLNDETPPAIGITLADLRAMRDRGELTDAEYETARDRISMKIKAAALQPRPKRDGKS